MTFCGLDHLVERHGTADKSYFDGTHRCRHPVETLERWRPEMARFGITRIADVTDLDVIGIPVHQAIRPNGRSLSTSQGKGATSAAAAVSALMEAAELWHAEHHRLSLRRASIDELEHEGVATADLGRVPRRADTQLDRHRPMLWVPGVDLVSGEPTMVPELLVSMDHTPPRDPLTDHFAVSSNGLASGNHILEAIAHALFEVIERDAWAIEVDRRQRCGDHVAIDPETVDDPTVRDLLAAACAADVGTELVDITSDLGMPCFSATVYEDDDAPLRRVPPSSGAGCHTDRGVAACRAISEAMQTRLTVIAGSRDDITEELHTVRRVSTAAGQFQRQLRRRPRTGSFLQAPTHETRSAADDVSLALESLVIAGMSQVVVVDLTMPDIGLPVVRVIAPGLEDTDGHGTIDRIHRLTERQQAS